MTNGFLFFYSFIIFSICNYFNTLFYNCY